MDLEETKHKIDTARDIHFKLSIAKEELKLLKRIDDAEIKYFIRGKEVYTTLPAISGGDYLTIKRGLEFSIDRYEKELNELIK